MMQRQRTISSLPKSGFNLLIVHTEFERHPKMLHIFADACTDAYINRYFVTQFCLHYFDPRYPDLRIPTHVFRPTYDFLFQDFHVQFHSTYCKQGMRYNSKQHRESNSAAILSIFLLCEIFDRECNLSNAGLSIDTFASFVIGSFIIANVILD